MKNGRGFTLLELMIVLVIMATLSVLSSQSIQQAIKNKIKLQRQIDDVSQVRDALKVMERDVNLAFHYTDLEMELRDMIKKKRIEQAKTPQTTTTQPGTPPPAAGTPPPATATYNPNDPNDPLNQKSENRIDPTTQFVGHENEVYFATLNSSRLNEGTQQADFVNVGYLIQPCRKPGESSSSGNCLVRKSSNVVEGDVTKQTDTVALLTDVTEFKLRYFGKGKQDWVNEWDSVQGDAVAKGRFPQAIEISLTVEKGEGDKKKKISMQIVAQVRFPNNTATDNANAQANQQAQPGGFPGQPQQPQGGQIPPGGGR